MRNFYHSGGIHNCFLTPSVDHIFTPLLRVGITFAKNAAERSVRALRRPFRGPAHLAALSQYYPLGDI